MPRRWTLTALLGLSLGGCLQRSLPIPPPSVQSIMVRDCDTATCGPGVTGALVELSGEGYSNGLLVVVDLTQSQMSTGRDVPGAVASISATGQWHVTVAPVRDGAGGVRAVQRGDVLSLYQVVSGTEDGVSAPVMVRIP